MGGMRFIVVALLLAGCASTSEPSIYDRQEKALHDPFSYSPDLKKQDMSVTGEGDNQALRKDVDHVFNP